ncbi:MAG: hypothetical protein KJ072_02310 [Verrucomicrobia bacterium]|nr:hypothetical protein [Verrucomicrobiota bacterium]
MKGSATVNGTEIVIKGGGSDIWGNSDNCYYYYTPIEGNFDVRVRVKSLVRSTAGGTVPGDDGWAKAELMARLPDGTGLPQGPDPHISMMTTASDGQNQVAIQYRQQRSGGSQWPPDIGVTIPVVRPTYPNTWMRLVRLGSVFIGYTSPDGQDWLENYRIDTATTAGFPPAWPNAVNIGFAVTAHNDASTSGAIATFDDLAFVTDPLVLATGHGGGFQVTIGDSAAVVVQSVTQVLLDGTEDVTAKATVAKNGAVTLVRYNLVADKNTFFASGSTHSVKVVVAGVGGGSYELDGQFTVTSYVSVPADYVLAAPATTPGLVVNRVYQTAAGRFPAALAGTTASAEMQLIGGMIDQGTGNSLPNIAEGPGPITVGGEFESGIWWTPYVNWEQGSGNIEATGAQPDNFNTEEPPGTPGQAAGEYGNLFPPGVLLGADPSNTADNFVIETIAYVNLKRGLHRWGVNSDDGFKVSVAPGQPSPLGIVLGEFGAAGGRGSADTIFDFAIETDGFYPIRMLWWEGGGGASCEWFSVNVDTGEKILIGDTQYYPDDAVQPFRTGQGRAHVRSISPAPGYGGASREPTIRIELANGRTSYVAGSARLFYNGDEVTPTIQGTVISYKVPTRLGYDSQQSVQFIWQENTTPATSWTNSWTFSTLPFTVEAMPSTSFWIEIEDFDHSGGQSVATANTMPYAGGAYSNLLATLNVDYFDDQNEPDAAIDRLYRGDRRPNHADLTVHTGTANLAQSRPNGFTSTVNYRLGWAGNFWGNYTRTIPQGIYRAYAALSSDNAANILQAPLDKVTAGVGTTSQTLQRIGTFYGNGATAWGSSVLVPMRTTTSLDAPLGAFNHPGGPVTLRFTASGGDADWFVFVPATDVPPSMVPGLSSPSISIGHIPYADLTVPGDVVMSWRLEDLSTAVDPATIKLIFDGVDVSTALVVDKVGSVTTVTYDPPGLLELGQSYPYEFSFRDTFSIPQLQSNSGTLVVNYIPETPAGAFLIEAEDFNTGGGDYLTEVDTMPYLGNAYTNLAAVEGIDYQRSSVVGDGDVYRIGETNNVPMGSNYNTNTYDTIRSINSSGTWEVTANYSCGWSGVGNWLNYTRTIPANTYQVWAGMSSDRAAVTNGMVASLSRVVGSASVSNQVVEAIGTFQSAGTRNWGATALVPLRNASQEVVEVGLSGLTTLRVDMDYGDVDYLMLIPTGGALPPEFTSVVINANGSITVTWEGDGVLEAAPSVTGPWDAIEGATSPFTLEPTEAMLFGRIKN